MGAYVINLDEYVDVGTHWIALYIHNNDAIYFDSFRVEHIPKEMRHFIGNVERNIYKMQTNNSIMCGYFCTGFIEFMLAGKPLIDYTSLFLPCDLKKMTE